MKRTNPVLLAAAVLLVGATRARAHLVTVIYSAEAVTVVDEPFGVEVPRLTVINGYFTFDLDTPDENPSQFDGEYPHNGDSGFLAEFLGNKVTGSGEAFYWVDLTQNFDNDTFRVYDGPRPVGFEGGIMSFNGSEDEDIELFLAVTDDVFDDDNLKDPFPLYDFGFLGTTHTFSLSDDQGTLLLQFLSVTEAVCGDAVGGGTIVASDALKVLKTSVGSSNCYRCVCDVDANGSIAASDALKVLKFAVTQSPALTCSVCT